MAESTRGFAVGGYFPIETVRAAAQGAEAAGYHSFWVNHPREVDFLPAFVVAFEATTTIGVGVGAIPLTTRSPHRIASEIEMYRLPLNRLRLGIGSGTGPGALDRLRAGVQELRRLLDTEIVVAPLGPKMCRLAGEVADGVLLNWVTPEYARLSREWISEGAERAGRTPPKVFTFVRCSLGTASRPKMEQEYARYLGFPHYVAHFRRQGIEPHEAAITAASASEIQERLADYEEVLNEVIVRAITPNEQVDEVLALLDAARPS